MLTLSMDQVLAIFYERNLDLIAAQYDIDRARAQQIIASAIPNPTFSFDVEQIAPRNNDRLGPYYNILVQQLIQTGGKRRLAMESSGLGAAAAEQDLQDTVRVLCNAVKKSYFSLLLAQKNAEVSFENKLRYEKLRQVHHLRLLQGDISEADFLRIEVEKLKAESDWNNATAQVDTARADLAKLLAWPKSAMAFGAKDEWPTVMPLAEQASEESLLAKALDQRPDIAAARARIEQAEKKLLLAKRSELPDVTVGLGYSHDPQNTQSDFAQIQMSVPLPVFYQKQGEVSQAVTDLNNARLNLNQTEQSLRADVVSTLAKWQAASQVADRFEQQILAKTDQIRDAAELSYLKGATSIIDLVEAERTHKSVLLEYYAALNNRTLTYADLQTAVGEK